MRRLSFLIASLFLAGLVAEAQPFMTNVQGRECISLEGEWQVIVDMLDYGAARGLYKNQTPAQTGRFVEYSFDDNSVLKVPGDWNSQRESLKYYESTIWYKKDFDCNLSSGGRYFLYFGAANYLADVYLNGELVGSHEGGFTPFEFEVSGKLKEQGNFLIVRVNSRRNPTNIPAIKYDWWNYGGLTREVLLIHEQDSYIRDYTLCLADNRQDRIQAKVKVEGGRVGQKVEISIPELKCHKTLRLSEQGDAQVTFEAHPQLWTPDNPKLYDVCLSYSGKTIEEKVGFRQIEAKDGKILLNGKEVFLKGVNCHDEIAREGRRAWSEQDAVELLSEVKALGCNFLRLTHYPQSEIMVRKAEEMGIMLWEEIPLWQGIAFSDEGTYPKAAHMLDEMISRDKNRCAIIMWSVSNETKPGTDRNQLLSKLISTARHMDPTRLITSAFSFSEDTGEQMTLSDPVCAEVDVIGVNKYYGWYATIDCAPKDFRWNIDFGKPVIFSEFGAEALYGNHGPEDIGYEWSEEYQAKVYRDDIMMFDSIPNLVGLTPWCLFDFRSPYRFHHYQQEWNRKGLLSDKGEKKMAWYILKEYYDNH